MWREKRRGNAAVVDKGNFSSRTEGAGTCKGHSLLTNPPFPVISLSSIGGKTSAALIFPSSFPTS